MWQVARATSAGPTFFPLMPLTDSAGVAHQCADGGLVANDPVMVGLSQAQSPPLDAAAHGGTLIMSIGTGDTPGPVPGEVEDVEQLSGTAPWWRVAGPAIGTLRGAPGILGREMLATWPGVAYVRLQPQLGFGAVHAMDNVLPQNTTALRQTAETFIANNNHMLSELAEKLVANT